VTGSTAEYAGPIKILWRFLTAILQLGVVILVVLGARFRWLTYVFAAQDAAVVLVAEAVLTAGVARLCVKAVCGHPT